MKSDFVGIGEADFISSEAEAEDFIRACEDFIVQSVAEKLRTISLKNIQGYALIYLQKCYIINSPKIQNSMECRFSYLSLSLRSAFKTHT